MIYRRQLQIKDMRVRARADLPSEEVGGGLRARRPVKTEIVLGRLKQNWGFRRFLRRGIEKVEVE